MRRVASLAVVALAVTACSTTPDKPSGSDDDTSGTEVVIATHDSWNVPDLLINQFEQDTGLKVTIVSSGDAGELTNKLVLTKKHPIADAVYGIDNTFASRAVDEGVLASYRSKVLPEGEYDLDAQHLTPVDWGDVCVNVDDVWFTEHKIAPPTSLEDLVKPEYKDLFVTPGAASSSPGFAFLLATIGHYGPDSWKEYWTDLMKNGTKVTSGWTDAYEVDFTAGGGNGKRPIVLSYNSSPPFTIPKGTDKPTTSALLDTCFRQVEYAGVLANAKNPTGAEEFIDFMEGRDFQEGLPDNMYVFPVDPEAKLPDLWAQWAKPAPNPIQVSADDIAANRDDWLTEWSDITSR